VHSIQTPPAYILIKSVTASINLSLFEEKMAGERERETLYNFIFRSQKKDIDGLL
jgi:hypothetical protein